MSETGVRNCVRMAAEVMNGLELHCDLALTGIDN